jgi:hypothetical protein
MFKFGDWGDRVQSCSVVFGVWSSKLGAKIAFGVWSFS